MDDSTHAWVTTVRPDGSPHTTPVWFLLRRGSFWFASARTNVKVRNLRRDPRVSVALDGTGRSPWVAEGEALLHGIGEHPEPVRRLAAKYGWDPADETRDGPRVLIEVRIARWLSRPSK